MGKSVIVSFIFETLTHHAYPMCPLSIPIIASPSFHLISSSHQNLTIISVSQSLHVPCALHEHQDTEQDQRVNLDAGSSKRRVSRFEAGEARR